MAIQQYVPNIWANDTVPDIDADNLNHIENGIKNATNEAIALNNEMKDFGPALGYTMKASVETYTSSQKRAYVYGNYKSGDVVHLYAKGTAVTNANAINVRYDDGTTAISYLTNNGDSKEVTLASDTSAIIFIINNNNITTDGTIVCSVESGVKIEVEQIKDELAEDEVIIGHIENSIGSDGNTLVAPGISAYTNYPFRMYAGCQYSITINGFTGNCYVRFLDKNGTTVLNKELSAASTFNQTFNVDIYNLQIYSVSGCTISETHTGVYRQIATNTANIATNTANIALNTDRSVHTENALGTDGNSVIAVADAHWIVYSFRMYAGCKYNITISDFTGTAYVSFRDKDGNAVLSKTLTASETFEYTFAVDIYDLRIYTASGCKVSETHTGVYKLTETFPEYAVKDNTNHVITVGKDGSKDYTTITDALASITDSGINNQYEIVVYPGVYNENNIVLKDYVHIYGIQANVVTVTSEGLDTTYSVFDTKKHCKLSNMRIISKTKYCVHIDSEMNYGTVICEGLYCEQAGTANTNVIGIGCWKGGALYIFRGCTFVNGKIGAHTNFAESDCDNTRLVFDGCNFIGARLDLGLAAGLGKNICEVNGMKTNRLNSSLTVFFNEYRTVDEPETYFACPVNWNIIGHGNENFIVDITNTRHGLMVQAADFDKPISISGSAVDALFGVTKVRGASSIIKGAVYGSLRVDDAQAGAGTAARPYVDRFQMWKRLGDCSVTNKTLTVTVDGESQTYTFDQDYTSSKPNMDTLIDAVNAVITNAVLSTYIPDCMEMVNTTDKDYVKVTQSTGIKKGMWVTYGGTKAGANYTRSLVKGIALEDGVKDEYIQVWVGNAMKYTAENGEYGIGSDGMLSASATTKIGYVYSNKFYLYAF